jgi:hypothetical protein
MEEDRVTTWMAIVTVLGIDGLAWLMTFGLLVVGLAETDRSCWWLSALFMGLGSLLGLVAGVGLIIDECKA